MRSMRGVWVMCLASLTFIACGRIGFTPPGGGGDDVSMGSGDARGPTGSSFGVTGVSPTGPFSGPVPVWNGEAFAIIITSGTDNGYQTFSEQAVASAAPTMMSIGILRQAITHPDGIALLHTPQPGSDVALAIINRAGVVVSDVVVANAAGIGTARIAKNLERDELCLVWADSDAASPRRVRAARTTLTGARIGGDLVVSTDAGVGYRRLDVGCRGEAIYVFYTVERPDGWYDYFIHTFAGGVTQVDVPVVPSNRYVYDVILMAPGLTAPVIAHGSPGLNVRIDSFVPNAPAPLAGPEHPCAAQFARLHWDGTEVHVGAACYLPESREAASLWTVTPLGATVRPPVEVQVSDAYGGTAVQIATSPSGHVAFGFTDWDIFLEGHRGYIGFLAP